MGESNWLLYEYFNIQLEFMDWLSILVEEHKIWDLDYTAVTNSKCTSINNNEYVQWLR